MNTSRLSIRGSALRNRFLLTQLSGFLSWMAFPHMNAHSSLAWICFSFWFLALRQAGGWKERLVHGLSLSAWIYLPDKWHIFWTITSNLFVSQVYAVLFFLLYASTFFLPYTLFSLAAPERGDRRISDLFYSVALWVVLFAWLPNVFPIDPALMVHDQPIAIQTADLGGTYPVDVLILFVNLLLAEILFYAWRDRRPPWKYLLWLLLTAGFIAGYGRYRLHEQNQMEQAGEGHYTHIAALQTLFLPNEPIASLIRQAPKGGYSCSELTELCAVHFPEASVIVWPELPIFVSRDKEPVLREKVSALAARLRKTVLYSSMEVIGDPTPTAEYCTARLILPDGTETLRYRKTSLVPFYELPIIPRLTHRGEIKYQPGQEETVFPLDDRTICIPSLCYDIHRQSHLRSGIRQGGNVIIHMSNFYAFNKSTIPFVDYTMSKLYAAAYRVPIVRSSNRGYGAFIRATGIPVEESFTTPDKRDIHSCPLFIPKTRSVYASAGNAFLYGLTGYVILWGGYSMYARRRYSPRQGPSAKINPGEGITAQNGEKTGSEQNAASESNLS